MFVAPVTVAVWDMHILNWIVVRSPVYLASGQASCWYTLWEAAGDGSDDWISAAIMEEEGPDG